MKTTLILFAWIFLIGCRAAAGDPEKLDPSQVTATLIPEKAVIMPGEPVWLSLVVKVKSAPNFQLDYPPASNKWAEISYNMVVKGEDGRRAPRAGSWLDVGNYIHGPAWIPLLTKPPYPAEYTYRLFLPFAATLRQPGTYTITAREDLQFYKYPDPKRDDSKKTGGYTTAAASIPIEATAKVVVGQPDDKKMGVLIDDLVKQATPLTTRDAANAYMALQSIPDERVVPYFLQSLQSDNGNLKIDALRVLSEFNNDAALGGLKDGMAPASPNVTNLSQGTTFRIIAAIGLLNSPHLDAIPTLLTYRHDPDPGVREIVVEAIATRLSPEKASPLLQEMSGDKNKDVSDAAKKGLAKLVKKS